MVVGAMKKTSNLAKQLCTYTVTEDSGFAPNPFWGWCTLAACTPNHQNADLDRGDWIAGFLSKSRQHGFLYAMEIAEVLNLGEYFADNRFQKKKPNLRGNWKARCGDNIYEQRGDGTWVQHENDFHNTPKQKLQDTRHPKVFVASRFWYFGRNYKPVPSQYSSLTVRRGIKSKGHDSILVARFMKWVAGSFPQGVNGEPNDIRQYVQLTRR